MGGPKFDDDTGAYKHEGMLKARLTFSGDELLGCPMQTRLQKVYGNVSKRRLQMGRGDDCSLVLPHPPRRKAIINPDWISLLGAFALTRGAIEAP